MTVRMQRRVVMVGAAVATNPPDMEPGERADAVALMADAVRSAALDSGAPVDRLLQSVEQVAVSQGMWQFRNAGRLIADSIGAPRARSVVVNLGIPQQQLINDAVAAIGSGAMDVCVVVGGEAKARDDRARRLGVELPQGSLLGAEPDSDPDEIQIPHGEIVAPAEIAARLIVPVEQYAVIENALRFADGLSIEEHHAEIDELWARFNAVAQRNPAAAFASDRSAADLSSTANGNRPLAFPYNRWHSTQWGVDQAAALILCSVDAADRLDVPIERRLYPAVSLTSSHSLSLSRRRDLYRWPAMAVLGETAAARLGRPLASIDHHELYSCFPVAVRVQQRELLLPIDGTPTITGGMAFAGGPFNNFVFQATAAMAHRLREEPGTTGLVTTVSGLLTKPGLAVWSTEAGDSLVADLGNDATARTPTVEPADTSDGPVTVVGYTVRYDNHEPASAVVIGDTANGRRAVTVIEDRNVAAAATRSELIGVQLKL
jgi:acetyl-CoA C-acetyltransferase